MNLDFVEFEKMLVDLIRENVRLLNPLHSAIIPPDERLSTPVVDTMQSEIRAGDFWFCERLERPTVSESTR